MHLKYAISNFQKSIVSFLIFLCLMVFNVSCKEDKTREADRLESPATAEAEAAISKDTEKERQRTMAVSTSIAGKAMDSADLDTLVVALKAADLSDMFSEPGNFTVFAPTDNAFAKLKKGALEDLLKPENKEKLRNVLEYHVVAGRVTSDQLAKAIANSKGKYTFKTVSGGELTAMMDGGQIVLRDGKGNKSQIVSGNVDASNGVIHIVNDVLMPKK